ncbi:MAG: LamG domain-containing protein [Candidatus Moraniibacteriota bacterium]|nr:MAG: LamG domain-containing protein [Candidatus Moranbacteria bacterium]
MKLSLTHFLQWGGIAAVLLVVVGLNYDFESKAGMQLNGSVESSLSQGMRGYWKLDDGSGTNATDSSGNANTLAMTGSPTWSAGQIGPYMLDFSGSGQYLSVADPASGVLDFANGADFSLTGWFNRDTFTADHTIVAKKTDQATNAGYVVWIDASTDTVNFEISDGTYTYEADSTTTFTSTGWHHFTAVWDDSRGASVYIDGGLNGSTETSTSSIGDLSNANAFRIGAESDAGVPFDGKLDDIRVYGYALSADEVKKLYNTTSPAQPVDTSLVGHWTFDGPDIQGSTAIDRSSFGNNGTITGAVPVKGKLGQGMGFDGTGDYVETNSTIPASGAFSISAWINMKQINDLPSIVNTSNSIFYYSSYVSRLYWTNNNYSTRVGGSSALNINQWYFVVVVNNSDDTATLYINGTQDGTANQAAGSRLAGGEICIGARSDGLKPFNGIIDDVRFYNRALSASEITNFYNMGR